MCRSLVLQPTPLNGPRVCIIHSPMHNEQELCRTLIQVFRPDGAPHQAGRVNHSAIVAGPRASKLEFGRIAGYRIGSNHNQRRRLHEWPTGPRTKARRDPRAGPTRPATLTNANIAPQAGAASARRR